GGVFADEHCNVRYITQTTEDLGSSPSGAQLPNDVCLERIDEAVTKVARTYLGIAEEEAMWGAVVDHHALYGDSDDQSSHAMIVTVSDPTDPLHVAVVYESEDCVIEYNRVLAEFLLPILE